MCENTLHPNSETLMPVEAGDYQGTLPLVAPKGNYRDNLFTRIQVDLRDPPRTVAEAPVPPCTF